MIFPDAPTKRREVEVRDTVCVNSLDLDTNVFAVRAFNGGDDCRTDTIERDAEEAPSAVDEPDGPSHINPDLRSKLSILHLMSRETILPRSPNRK